MRARILVMLAAVAVLLLLVAPATSSASTLTQARAQLRAWHLSPPPLFPSSLPAAFSGANVTLDRSSGVDFDSSFGKPANGCQRVNESDLCMETSACERVGADRRPSQSGELFYPPRAANRCSERLAR